MFDRALTENQEHHLELSVVLSLQLSSSKWQSTELITDRFIHEKRMDKVIPMFQEGRLGWECQHDLPKENAPSGSIEVLKRKVLNWFVNVLISSGNRGAYWRPWKIPMSKDVCPGRKRYETSSYPQCAGLASLCGDRQCLVPPSCVSVVNGRTLSRVWLMDRMAPWGTTPSLSQAACG